jgi:hypothetical protein
VTLADATGGSDTLTIGTQVQDADDVVDAAIVTTGIETVTFDIATQTASQGNMDLNVSSVAAAAIVVKGGTAAEDLDLTNGGGSTFSGTTTSLDASAFLGTLVADAEANTAVTMTVNGGAAVNLAGGTGNDTFTIGSGIATHDIAGGGGADTVNITLATGTTSMATMEGVETYNMTAATGAAIVVGGATSKFMNDTMVGTVTLSGGGSSSTFDNTDGIDTASSMTLFDASGYDGKINDLLFDADQLDATVTVKGGASTSDLVSATVTAADTVVRMEGIETLGLTFAGTQTADLGTYATGFSKVTVTSDGTARVATLNKLAAGVTVDVTLNDDADGLTIIQSSTSGTSDTQSIEVKANNVNEDFLLDMQGVETLTLKSSGTDGMDLNLTNFDMDTAGQTNALVVTGANSLDIITLSADTTSINASAMTAGGVDIEARSVASTALTFTGSTFAESVIMLNKNDAFSGGEASGVVDTIDINFNAVLGGIGIDLTASDQITTFDGAANSTVTSGFESVDLRGYVGYGASLTGNDEVNTLFGTAKADNITAGAGIDNIASGIGADVINLTETTAAADIISFGNETHLTGGTDIAFGSLGGADAITGLNAGATDDALTFDISAFGLAGSTTDVDVVGNIAAGDEIFVVTGGGYGSDELAEDALAASAVTGSLDFIMAYFNTGTNKTHIIHDTDGNADGTGTTTLIATLEDFTTQALHDTLDANNFVTIA